jgi:NADH-quinone oxidoreductase subunit F
MLGTTAVQIFNETVSVPWAVSRWADFYRHESCGKCAPCREGTAWMSKTLRRIITGHGTLEDIDTLEDTAFNIFGRAFCALGDGAATSVSSAIKEFRQEFVDLVTGITPAPMAEADLIEMPC